MCRYHQVLATLRSQNRRSKPRRVNYLARRADARLGVSRRILARPRFERQPVYAEFIPPVRTVPPTRVGFIGRAKDFLASVFRRPVFVRQAFRPSV